MFLANPDNMRDPLPLLSIVHPHPSPVSAFLWYETLRVQTFIYQAIRSQLRPIRFGHRDSAFALVVLRPAPPVSCGRSMAVFPALSSHRLAPSVSFARSQAESTTSGTGWPILGSELTTKPPCLSQGAKLFLSTPVASFVRR